MSAEQILALLSLLADLRIGLAQQTARADAAEKRLADLTRSKVACPSCGARPGEWCDSTCTAHAAGTCGLPHPKEAPGAQARD